MSQPTLLLTPRRPALLSGFDNQLDVLMRLQAPEQGPTTRERSPLNVAIVLDRSGSMSGQPLAEAKRCAGFLVDRLGGRDRAAIVIYDDQVDLLVPSTRVDNKQPFHKAIQGIDSGGMTDLHGGWLKGADQVSPHITGDSLSRVLLLSDGQANAGLTENDEISRQCAELAAAGVSTSTYGLGRDFNESLMIDMARSGQGSSYYGRTAEDLMDPFEEEFDLLSALFAKGIRLRLDPSPGMTATILNRFPQQPDGAYSLPDLAYEGEAWALVRVNVPKAAAGNGDGVSLVPILKVSVSCRDLDGAGLEIGPVTLALPSLPASAWKAVAEDELVVRRAAELEAANIQDQAQSAARQEDWGEVRRLLAEAGSNAENNEWLAEVVVKLEDIAQQEDSQVFTKEASYASQRMRTRLAMAQEPNVPEAAAAPAPSYLRRKAEQGKAEKG